MRQDVSADVRIVQEAAVDGDRAATAQRDGHAFFVRKRQGISHLPYLHTGQCQIRRGLEEPQLPHLP